MSDDGATHPAGLLDYNWFHYTLLDGLWPLSISLLLGWLGFLFYLMASITNGFFVPGVNKLTQLLTLSNKLAGVTFLAVCNGLPHVIAGGTAIVFSSPTLGIGSLVGSGLINGSLIWAFILVAAPFMSSRELSIYRRPFFRDLSFVFLALVGVFVLVFFKHVKWWMPLVFLTCYCFYLLIIFVGRWVYQRFSRKRREALGIIEDEEELQELAVLEENEDYPNLDELMFINRQRPSSSSSSSSKKEDQKKKMLPDAYSILDDSEDEENHSDIDSLLDRRPDDLLLPGAPSDDDENDERNIAPMFRRKPKKQSPSPPEGQCERFLSYIAISIRWHELSLPQRIWFVVSLPVILIRNATIPIVGDEEWIFFWALINPIASPLIVLLATHHFATASIAGVFPVWALLLCIGAVLSIIIFFTSSVNKPPVYYGLFVIGCLLMCLVWMYLVSCEIVDLLRLLGSVFDVSDSGMGLTVMAWGICAGDVYTNLSLTTQGFRNMALSASLSSPTFTLLIGIGLSLLIKVALEGGQYVIHLDPMLDLGFGSFALLLIIICIAVPIMKFRPTQIFAWFQVIFYVAFLVFVILFELQVLPPHHSTT